MAAKADRWDPNDQGPDDEEEGPANNGRTPPPSPPSRGGGASKGKGGGLMSSTKNTAKDLGKTAPGRRGKAIAHDTGNIIVGLVIYAIGINYLRYGPAGVKAYFAAKLINRTEQAGLGVPDVTPSDFKFRRPKGASGQTATATTGLPATEAPTPSSAGRNYA